MQFTCSELKCPGTEFHPSLLVLLSLLTPTPPPYVAWEGGGGRDPIPNSGRYLEISDLSTMVDNKP